MQEKKFLIALKANCFQIKNFGKIPTHEPAAEPAAKKTPTKHKKSTLKLEQESINEIIADEKGLNNETFLDCFKYQNASFLIKNIISTKESKNQKIVNTINKGLIDFRNTINRKKNPELENPKKVINKLLKKS